MNRTIIEKTRALLFQAKLPKTYWGEAVKAAEYLYNRTPHLALKNRTLFELKYGQKPDISNIRVWGSICYRKMPEKQLKKLDPRAKPYILVGYGSNQYKLLDPNTKKIIWCRDVYILEGKFREPLDTPYPEDD